jgi:hypothetical protein
LSRGRREALAAAALFLVQCGLLVRTAMDKSDTADEPVYLAVSVPQWLHLDLASHCEIPALPRWAFAAALRLSDPVLFDESIAQGRHPLWSRPPREMRRNLLAARATTIAVTLLGGLFLWSAARRFGEGVGLVTYALWCLSPSVLASGALATLDGWVTALACVALWATVRFVESPTAARAALLGGVLALAAASKTTALGLAPVAAAVGAWALVRHARSGEVSRARGLLSRGLALAGAFLLTLWAAYGFRSGYVDTAALCGNETGLARPVVAGPLPFHHWVEGLLAQALHGAHGHLGYLFGEVGFTGWWWFYLAALALKTTVGAQVLAGLRVAAWAKSPPARRELAVDAAILAFPVLLVVVMSLGKAQNGIKYILPAFPFAMLWVGRGLPDVRRAFGRRGLAVGALALLGAAAESLAAHPHHLMFFNLWAGGPKGGPRYLVNGDDWGQDQRRLGEWQRQTRPWRLYYTFYNGDPAHWGIAFEPPPCAPQPGYYALHAVEVHRPKRIAPGCLDWLTVEPPDARLGYSIYLYQVNKARIERLVAARGTKTPFWRSGTSAGGP